jgi:hypothetical protein
LKHLLRFDITFQVMAVTEVSASHQHAIGTVLEALEDKIGIYPPGAHHPDDTKIRGILKSTDASQIRRRICTPVAGKGDDPWFEFP